MRCHITEVKPMSSQSQSFDRNDLAAPYETENENVTSTLVIGDLDRWIANGRDVPDLEGFNFTELEHLTNDLLMQMVPDIILSPLITDGFDALEVAHLLASFGYKGRYRAVTEAVPNARMILRELRAAAPGLDVDLLILPQKAAND